MMQTPCRILLAEDDSDDRILFRQFLQHRTDIVISHMAEDGIVLLEYLDAISNDNDLPDVIILDQNMPIKNGIQTLEALKANKRYDRIHVVIYSTYADQKLIASAAELGATRTIVKPSTMEGYNTMIDKLLEDTASC